jgi:DNA-directed RNA polymerase specialized sigma24 family protein
MNHHSYVYEGQDHQHITVSVSSATFMILVQTDKKSLALKKQDKRHIDDRSPEECPGLWFVPPLSTEEQYERKELHHELHRAMHCLTAAQRRHIRAYYFDP